jgi:hypothetical protein
MRASIVVALLASALSATTASAYDALDPANCIGVDWSDKQTQVVSKIAGAPRVSFIKSPYDDDFKAESCPAATDACRKKSYLVNGDLVLTGRTKGEFTCVSYQSPTAKQRGWARGWMPTAALEPVAPLAAPKQTDWIGTWSHPGGDIEIKRGEGGKLNVSGEMVLAGGLSPHSGVIEADVAPIKDTIAFVDDGSTPFDKADGECRVRMQRIGAWLMVEDNAGCGGVGVTFTGLYHRKK